MEWPAGLKSVQFGDTFRKPLKGVNWPQQLEEVVLGKGFNKDLSDVAWPASLRHLTVSNEHYLGNDRSNVPALCKVTALDNSEREKCIPMD